MIDIKRFEEILNIESTTERCERVLAEIQPKLNEVIREFINIHSKQDSSLLDYEVRTYEATLRTIYNESINPKYSDGVKDTSVGSKDFSMLVRKFGSDVELCILSMTFYGRSRTLRIGIETDFYYLWQALREEKIGEIVRSFNDGVKIFLMDTPFEEVNKEELLETIKTISKSKKRPWFFIGLEIPFESVNNDESVLIDILWKAWCELKLLREFNLDNGIKQRKTLEVLSLLKGYNEDLNISLYGHDYEIKFGVIERCKSRAGYWQRQSLFENGQLVTNGYITYYKYNNYFTPQEILSVDVDGLEQIYTSPRVLLGEGVSEWFIRKAYAKQNKDNAELLRKAMEALKFHGLEIKDNNYYVAAFDNSTMNFVEDIKEIKARILKAALIFADTGGAINLPKESVIKNPEGGEHGGGEGEEGYRSNFDLSEIIKMAEDSKFTFSRDIIRDFHLNLTALGDKHFVILNGISGTGKTQICRVYANAVYGLSYEDQNKYLKVIPVRPDWTDSTALFGYYSAIQKRYVMTEFLQTVLSALNEREKPHFVVLDEMNLSRVEYYLSDYLSAVESRKTIGLHCEDNIENVPKEIIIPPNLYIIGTVNIDETTYAISDKVLDRAFVMTLSDIDLKSYWYLIADTVKNSLENEYGLLCRLHDILKPYDLHFGYRSMDEMINKMRANLSLPTDLQMDRKETLDRVVCEKVLPKMRGDERIESLINNLLRWADEYLGRGSETERHLLRMKGELERYGAAQFWR